MTSDILDAKLAAGIVTEQAMAILSFRLMHHLVSVCALTLH
jgi:hypothetical protein